MGVGIAQGRRQLNQSLKRSQLLTWVGMTAMGRDFTCAKVWGCEAASWREGKRGAVEDEVGSKRARLCLEAREKFCCWWIFRFFFFFDGTKD